MHTSPVCARQESISYSCVSSELYGGVNSDLLQEGLCHTQVCCTQSPCPCGSPLLTGTSSGDNQTQLCLSLCRVSKKGRGIRDQIANIRWIMEKPREFQKNIHFSFIDHAKAFDCVDHNKLWKILKEMGIPEHMTCLLRNLYADQEATARTEHGTTDWFQIGKGVRRGFILSPCLFNLYAEYIMRNAGLEEAQAGIKTAGRNINNLRYADDTTLMEENKGELKNLLMKVKEENEKFGLKLNIQKSQSWHLVPYMYGK